MNRWMGAAAAGAVALMLSGCVGIAEEEPAPEPTAVTAPPESPVPPEELEPAVGDELTPLNAWDICFAHTTTQVQSDVTEWSRYSDDLVEHPSVGTLIVTIDGVRSGSDTDDAGTVTCQVEGRVGGAVIAEWTRAPAR